MPVEITVLRNITRLHATPVAVRPVAFIAQSSRRFTRFQDSGLVDSAAAYIVFDGRAALKGMDAIWLARSFILRYYVSSYLRPFNGAVALRRRLANFINR